MYHQLSELGKGAPLLDLTWTVSPQNFQAQMNWLAQQGYRTVTFPQVVAYLKHAQPLPSRPVLITFDDGWLQGYTEAFPVLRQHSFSATYFVYTDAMGRPSSISWEQLQEMSKAGMDVGSHTLSHPHLRQLGTDQAFREIAESRSILERRLNRPVTTFDYPFGEYDSSTVELVKRAGFESAVTIAPGFKQSLEGVFTLRRIRVSYETTLAELAKSLP